MHILIKGFGRTGVVSSKVGGRSFTETATDGGNLSGFGIGGNYGLGASAIIPNTDLELLDGLISFRSDQIVRKVYRDIYWHDVIAGGAVDIQSTIPFSDFSLSGINDPKVLEVYMQAIENMSILTLLPSVRIDQLVLGTFIGVTNFDREINNYTSLTPINIDMTQITPAPLFDMDPIIDLRFAKDTQRYLRNTKDHRYQRIRNKMPQWMIDGISKGRVLLDSANVIYLPRKTLSTNNLGTSYFRRILPIHIMEKAILRGSIQQAYRRQRAIGWARVGDDEWEPTNNELSSILSMLQCLTGDTLISIENKLTRLDKICSRKGMQKDEGKKINLKIKGKDGKIVTANKWWYRGYDYVNNIKTEHGYSLKATDTHRILVLNDKLKLIWKYTKDLKIGDKLCLDSNISKSENNTQLKVDINLPTLVTRPQSGGMTAKAIDIPKEMYPKLAYLLGLLVSEGHVHKHYVAITNSAEILLEEAIDCFKEIFYLNPRIEWMDRIGQEIVINGVHTGTTRSLSGVVRAHSIYASHILQKLGVSSSETLRLNGDKYPANYKEIPWSILQADDESKYAFIAAYLDGDGGLEVHDTNSGKNILLIIRSFSKKLLKQMQIMLLDLGYHSHISYDLNRLTINRNNAAKLYAKISKYLKHPDRIIKDCSGQANDMGEGIPVAPIRKLFQSRFIRSEYRKHFFLNDEGKEISIKHYGVFLAKTLSHNTLRTEAYNRDEYKNILDALKIISKKFYNTVVDLLGVGYRYESITSITKLAKKQHLYDLTIDKKSESAFVANGIVVHNSADMDPIGAFLVTRNGIDYQDIREGGQFWSFNDVFDTFSNAKMRGLGISEGLLSQENTYSTLEASISMFMDQIKSDREQTTREMFTNRIFANIAITNDFKRKNPRMEVPNDAEQYPTLSSMTTKGSPRGVHRTEDGRYFAVCSSASARSQLSEYQIPSVHWHKQLEPKGDRDYVDLLSTLEEKGVPVPLRVYAASVGVDLDAIVQGMDNDKKLRKEFAKFKQETGGGGDEEEQGGGQGQQFASDLSKSVGSSVARVGLGNRTTDDPRYKIRGSNNKGTPQELSRKGEKLANERMHKLVANILAERQRQEIVKENSKFNKLKGLRKPNK